ncbi:hypothetical protein CCAX7_001420 [Capsulimonas corticalis]|uniref:Uncharacterized protein n=2 Tax=Capsulimonas corticalis TaxID=2219043 RepID=A0A402CRQ6_9BACT|nr:hypothetical protein CCAX7_001420 [Capsulimonas corticalis]
MVVGSKGASVEEEPPAAPPSFWTAILSRARGIAAPLLAYAVAALGLLNLWSALLARGPGRGAFLRDVVHMPMVIEHGTRTLTTLFGLGLLMLARSLLRRKRQAWSITVLLVIVTPFLHLAKGLDWEEAAICLVILIGLLTHRTSFYAENDRPSARQGVLGALGMLGFALVYGPLGVLALHHQFRPEPNLSSAIAQSSHLLFYVPVRATLSPLTRRANWFEDSLGYISAFALGYAVFMVLRPVLPRDAIGARDRAHVRHLLTRWGGAPLSYYALLPDKRYLLDTEHIEPQWGVAYCLVGRHALALGDPLGDPALGGRAIQEFVTLCAHYDWSPSFYQVTGRYLDEYRAVGLKPFKIGEDAVIDLPSFSLKGKAFQDLRTALNKMSKGGVALEEYDTGGVLDPETLTQLADITEEWLAAHKGQEKGYAMGQFAPESDLFHDSRLFLARDAATRRVLAFVTFVPIYGGSDVAAKHGVAGWGLDLMRRRGESPNGVMEFLIASAAAAFQQEGALSMSLGLSPLADSEMEDEEECGESEWLARLRALIFDKFNQFYNFKGLNAFKAKFAPQWQSRYLVYPATHSIGATIYAAGRAHNLSGRFSVVEQWIRKLQS